ncbi:TCP-1 chaperonin subunit theta [Spironucleus salmonicida]|uniref:CCT-theta n=1 Tax=Spironucleus salmonicida TaxID=348837 RepID=V6M0I9_9EUKA|nr:TCP-1 chaperonin subunit theta [Spironucleus salmonicida]|eukprot:EST46649.1 TCP-1 chaperonin subunit theta [Spironucleus salmonicida]
MSVPTVGLQSMLKGGTRNLQGTDEAIYGNINACRELASISRTSMGPQGLFKMIVTHLEKLIITKNAAQLTSELEIRHPAAKMLVMAAQNQALEYGDGTNLVISLAGELLNNAENLLKQGIPVVDIVSGYETVQSLIPDLLQSLITETAKSDDREKLSQIIKSAVSAKQYGYEDIIAKLVIDAVFLITKDGDFNPDHVRVAKVAGCGIEDSFVVKGFVVPALPRGSVNKQTNTKIAVFGCPVELRETETKGTILLENAEDLKNLNSSEEKAYEELILSFKNAGITTLVSQYNFHELAIHFCNKYGMMAIKIASKYEVRRFALSVNAELMTTCRLPERMSVLGAAEELYVDEIGDKKVLIVKDEGSKSISTVVIRAATDNFLNDAAVALGNGVNVAKAAMTDGRFLPGAGATELALSAELKKIAMNTTGLEQYGIRAFAEALEVVPRVLAETSGQKSDIVVNNLIAEYSKGNIRGVDIESDHDFINPSEKHIYDSYAVKNWAIRVGCDAACSILRVDQVIMRKQAGGPNPQEAGQGDWN